MVRDLSEGKRTSSSAQHQSQKKSSVMQLDHSFYKVPGSVQNLKVHTFIGASTSMCGAVIVPDLSENQVGVKALKQFILVNGFTHRVLQCDGQSGLMKLQDPVGKDLSLPTQSNQSPVFTSKSGNCRKVSQDSLRSGQGNQTWTRCSSWNSS